MIASLIDSGAVLGFAFIDSQHHSCVSQAPGAHPDKGATAKCPEVPLSVTHVPSVEREWGILYALLSTLTGVVFTLSLPKSYVSVSWFYGFWQAPFDISLLQTGDSQRSISWFKISPADWIS